jgi:ribosomal protein S6
MNMDESSRQYELTCILSPHLEGAELENAKNEIEKSVKQLNGAIVFKETGKRPLAYPINKEGQGIFLNGEMTMSPENMAALLKELKLNKLILRHLINHLYVPREADKKPARRPMKPKTEIIKEKKKAIEERKTAEDKKTLEEIDKKIEEIIGEI